MTITAPLVYNPGPLVLRDITAVNVGIKAGNAYILDPNDPEPENPKFYPFALLYYSTEAPQDFKLNIQVEGEPVFNMKVKTRRAVYAPQTTAPQSSWSCDIDLRGDDDTPIHIFFYSLTEQKYLPTDPVIIVNPPTYP